MTPDLPPPPLLDQLAGVNDNPRKVYFPTPGGDKKRAREGAAHAVLLLLEMLPDDAAAGRATVC